MIEKVTVQLATATTFVVEGNEACDQMNPKRLMLYAAALCSAHTVLHIMHKEHLKPIRLEVTVSGDLTGEMPESDSVFRSFHVLYNVACGPEEDQVKASRAIRLAHDKYCGMMQMLRQIAPVAHEVAIVSTQPA